MTVGRQCDYLTDRRFGVSATKCRKVDCRLRRSRLAIGSTWNGRRHHRSHLRSSNPGSPLLLPLFLRLRSLDHRASSDRGSTSARPAASRTRPGAVVSRAAGTAGVPVGRGPTPVAAGRPRGAAAGSSSTRGRSSRATSPGPRPLWFHAAEGS